MHKSIPIVDLFSGPGGLAEGFSAFSTAEQRFPFQVTISIEREASAHATLHLRSFLRKFNYKFPDIYYDFLNGNSKEPDWSVHFPNEWRAAEEETKQLELGKEETAKFLRKIITEIHAKYGHQSILIGGPPCQAYSLAGRVRNAGISSYVPHKDERTYLYQEYVSVLKTLEPAMFVMENVKGILSSAVNGDSVFLKVLSDLRSAAGIDSYTLCALAPTDKSGINLYPKPNDFTVRAEEFGIPQSRHRVIVVGLRQDIAKLIPSELFPRLMKNTKIISVDDVIGNMPPIRSGLSRKDSLEKWSSALQNAIELVNKNIPPMPNTSRRVFRNSIKESSERVFEKSLSRVGQGGTKLSSECSTSLQDWIFDEYICQLPNHESRAHMPSDLARYLFASAYGRAYDRSPKASDFPEALAPNHLNWNSGKFSDRFRVQLANRPANTITSHISKDGHYYIHPDPSQCRSITVREAARLQTFPDNYYFKGNRTQQYVQVGNAVPPYLAYQIAASLWGIFEFLYKSTTDSKNHHKIPAKSRNSSQRLTT